MQEPSSGAGPGAEFGPLGRALLAASQWTAIAGGVIFIAVVLISVVSIVGRKVAGLPVPGDVEMLQMGAAFASAAFFAYTHMMRGDVKVDLFTNRLGPNKIAFLDAVGSLLVGLFGALIAWRAWAGAMAVKEVGETSAILELPVWVAEVLMVPSFALLAAAGFYMCVHTWSRRGVKA
ncbi:MAG: TRAP transporter small permease [Zoogloeaceae bacterium]|jgi:TRAP-type mannitol/chloroaromatic compound transport system permease small subunit|nr:TRAP transporter small permease [Zoogloeaceae bacterium]